MNLIVSGLSSCLAFGAADGSLDITENYSRLNSIGRHYFGQLAADHSRGEYDDRGTL